MPKPCEILVVDDNPEFLQSLLKLLYKFEYNTSSATCVAECIALLQDHLPDIILLDSNLPDGSGEDLCREIKNNPATQHIIILLMSGMKSGDTNRINSVELGADGFLEKPLRADSLQPTLKSFSRIAKAERRTRELLLRVRESEKRYKMVSEITADYAYEFRVTEDGKIVREWTTSSYQKITGYEVNEIDALGGFVSIVHPDDIEKANAHLAGIISGSPATVVLRFIKKTGEARWIRLHSYPQWNESRSRVDRFFGGAVDVTEEQRARIAFNESESRYRILIENMREGVMQITSDGTMLFVNDSYCRMAGYKREELLGKKVQDIIFPPEEKAGMESRMQKRREGVPEVYEIRMLKKSGVGFLTKVSGTPLYDLDGNIIGSMGIITDITSQKRNEEILKILSNAVNQTAEMVVIGNKQGIIEYINPAFEQQTGFTSEDMIGQHIHQFWLSEQVKEEVDEIWSSLVSGNTWSSVVPNRNKKHERFFEERTVSPIHDDENNMTHFVSTSKDITERIKAEAELREAKERAEELNNLKTNFLANMSHELRTPMSGVLGYAEILNESLTDPQLREMAQTILTSGNRLMDTLNSILDLSRIESAKVEIALKRIHLFDVAQRVVRLFEATASNQGLYLRLVCDSDNVWVKADEVHVEKVLHNLVNNAIKFTGEGGITVRIHNVEQNGEMLGAVSVTDTGIGIHREHQKVIFQEFRQVSEGLSRRYEGSGLGLTISKKLVDLMGGIIQVESAAGFGSTFLVGLHLADTIAKPSDVTIRRTEKLSGGTQEPMPAVIIEPALPKLLVVEDDRVISELLRISLSRSNDVTLTGNGTEAVELCKKNQYNVVLMDINLGDGMNGLEVVDLIRKMKHHRETPIVALTAYAMVGDREEFLAGGCTHYVSKPFDMKKLVALVEEISSVKKD